MSFDFRSTGTPIGTCSSCGRPLMRPYPGGGYQDADGFVQCRPRNQPYLSSRSNTESPDGGHHLQETPQEGNR